MKPIGFRIGVVACTLAAALIASSSALAADGHGNNGRWGFYRSVGDRIHKGHLPRKQGDRPAPAVAPAAAAAAATGTNPPLGTVKYWPYLDDAAGQYGFTKYTLRGLGNNIEVWVQNDLSFPGTDCRNGARTTITDAQVSYFVSEFDSRIYPKESQIFSVPDQRPGESPFIAPYVGLPNDYWAGKSDNIVVLISNVRDTNYYDTNNAHGYTYIGGFFSSQLNDWTDRNVMTVDAFDWLHRTGANPPNEPVPGDLCASAPARPFSYEGTFAHEYQHLLESYASPGELSWINEGISDWAISYVGYGHPEKAIDEIGFESHVQSFLGWLGVQTAANPNPRQSGPENSLTLWGDQGDDDILSDYGASWSLMLYLEGRFGPQFLSALHNEDRNGLDGLQAVLDQFGSHETALNVLHEFAAAAAIDKPLEDAPLRGFPFSALYSIKALHASINWDTPKAYQEPGAPPNGSDYVRLRDAQGNYLAAGDIRSLRFDGAKTLPSKPVDWTTDSGALYSGTGDEIDHTIIREVTVPSANPTVSFSAKWNLEELWDFAFVQVSTDKGVSFSSVACPGTTTEHDEAAYPTVKANVPGFTGFQPAFTTVTCDLSAYAGKTVALAFRSITDWATNGNETVDGGAPSGFWVQNVSVGGTAVGSNSLDGWLSPTQYRPFPVAWTVQLVGYGTAKKTPAIVVTLPLQANGFVASLDGGKLRSLIGNQIDVVAAIVTFDDPTETAREAATYLLSVNGVRQPGGAAQ